MKSTLASLALFAISPAAAQGFYESCYQSWSLGYHHSANFLVASCPGSDGANHTGAIDLQDCLTNTEGVLKASRLGSAFHSCNSCSASTTNATITCQCQNSTNRYLTTELDLDTVITNKDGIVGCFDFPGIEVAPAEL
ncbi:putative Cyanovirin-N domain-containing protein [Seiridium cardinale]|uniref:Cyanovirin-N domain-containing protein n=1 Tax=Seiridium cardinale TaxID=138064 RepID=A0ABR2XJD2_9PEZI